MATRALLFGGVAMACAAGVGVGLWARPSDLERPGAPKVQPAALPMTPGDRRLAIVVDDTPAPVGKPLDVLGRPAPRPATAPPHAQAQVAPRMPAQVVPPAAAELAAPRRPPEGLVRVVAPIPGPLIPAKAPPPPVTQIAPVVAPRPVKAKAAAPIPTVSPPKVAAAKAGTAKVRAAKIPPAKPRADRSERLALKASRGKHRVRETEMAEAAAPPPKPRHGLSAITHVLARLAPHHAKIETAEAAPPPHKARKDTPARAEVRQARAAPEKPARVRLASAPSRCASSDPGEALTCGDPNLSAADRRLTRAYRDAEAAGVPAATLERQQQRWRAARAAAAREAPWAVREVYQARIAELQDQARDARGD